MSRQLYHHTLYLIFYSRLFNEIKEVNKLYFIISTLYDMNELELDIEIEV